jgi:hypothetical protein
MEKKNFHPTSQCNKKTKGGLKKNYKKKKLACFHSIDSPSFPKMASPLGTEEQKQTTKTA